MILGGPRGHPAGRIPATSDPLHRWLRGTLGAGITPTAARPDCRSRLPMGARQLAVVPPTTGTAPATVVNAPVGYLWVGILCVGSSATVNVVGQGTFPFECATDEDEVAPIRSTEIRLLQPEPGLRIEVRPGEPDVRWSMYVGTRATRPAES
ncbi:hypothetical protein GCM10010123_35520 [Pilimelia anulata]|uniref:Uncharacterized protein n=1 Tax=Pilimelia anulata TaxID=53371 RepID=A0A8J3B990_9ACTN|nr:hypothetical protein GCM10010123_35520 [Pilimelia anulata]